MNWLQAFAIGLTVVVDMEAVVIEDTAAVEDAILVVAVEGVTVADEAVDSEVVSNFSASKIMVAGLYSCCLIFCPLTLKLVEQT